MKQDFSLSDIAFRDRNGTLPVASPEMGLPVLVSGTAAQLSPTSLPLTWPGVNVRGDRLYGERRGMRSFHTAWLSLVFISLACLLATGFAVSEGGPVGVLPLVLPASGWLALRLESQSWRYQIYQNRLDFERGLFSKQKWSVWIWQIVDVKFERSLAGWVTNTAMIRILVDKRASGQGPDSISFEIVGLRNALFMEGMWEELQNAALVERRAIKWWGV